VTDDQSRPTVTISDPSRPAAGEELGGEPWRPTRRQLVVPAAFLLVLAAVLITVGLLHERQVDRAALRAVEVRLADGSGGASAGASFEITVHNSGPRVQLVGTQVDDHPAQAAHLPVPAGADTAVVLPPDACPTSLPTAPTAVTLQLRTTRDQLVKVRLPLAASAFGENYIRTVERHCNLLPVEESITLESTGSDTGGASLQLSLALHNSSVLPRTLVALSYPGVTITSTDLPLTLTTGIGGELTVQLKVRDCRTAFSYDSRLTVTVRGDGRTVRLPQRSIDDRDDIDGKIASLISTVCPY
jgi:hypothetical protein